MPVVDGGGCEVLGWDSPASTDNSGGGDEGSKCSKSGSEAAAKVRRLPPGPLKWVRDGDGVQNAVATGRIGDVQRSETIAILDVK